MSKNENAFEYGRELGRSHRFSNNPIATLRNPRDLRRRLGESAYNSFVNGIQAGYNEAGWQIEDEIENGQAQIGASISLRLKPSSVFSASAFYGRA